MIAAASPVERAALGYLHGNCGHCHSAPDETGAPVPVEVLLAQDVAAPDGARRVLRSLVGVASRFQPSETSGEAKLVVPGDAADSVLANRMRSRDPRVQMPPLGTAAPDSEGLALIERWIDLDLPKELRTGRHLGRGRPILPPMPIPMYKHFDDEDLEAIFAYLQSVPAIHNRVPEPRPPANGARAARAGAHRRCTEEYRHVVDARDVVECIRVRDARGAAGQVERRRRHLRATHLDLSAANASRSASSGPDRCRSRRRR